MVGRSNARDAQGFTLIELMITVAVVAILAAIAYPSYQEQIRRTRRAEAQALMIEYAQLAERYRTVQNTYAGFSLPAAPSTARYRFVAGNLGRTTFTITATPGTAQSRDRCGTLTLNQAGTKGNSTGSLAECW